jgi:hypothetical protein
MKILLLLALALATNSAQADNLKCAGAFDDILVSPEVSIWSDKVQRTLEAIKIDKQNLNPFQDAVVDAAKLQFLEIQKAHLEPMLKSNKLSFRDLGIFKPLIVWEPSRPEVKYYMLMAVSGTYLFAIDGTSTPIRLTTNKSIGFTRQRNFLELTNGTSEYKITEEGIQYSNKSPEPTAIAKENSGSNVKVVVNGIEVASPPALFSSPNTNYFLQALKKVFQPQIAKLLAEGKITEADLQQARSTISSYSEQAFALLPNSSRTDYYLLSLETGSLQLLSQTSPNTYGSKFYGADGRSIELTNGIGFLPNVKARFEFNSILADALLSIQKQSEFVLGRILSKVEVEALTTSFTYLMTNRVDLNNINDLANFLKP